MDLTHMHEAKVKQRFNPKEDGNFLEMKRRQRNKRRSENSRLDVGALNQQALTQLQARGHMTRKQRIVADLKSGARRWARMLCDKHGRFYNMYPVFG